MEDYIKVFINNIPSELRSGNINPAFNYLFDCGADDPKIEK